MAGGLRRRAPSKAGSQQSPGRRRDRKTPAPPIDDDARQALREQVRKAGFASERLLMEALERLAPEAEGGTGDVARAPIEAALAGHDAEMQGLAGGRPFAGKEGRVMFKGWATLVIAWVLCAASDASAQPAAPPTTVAPPVTVTVQAPRKPQVIQQQTRAFVQGYAATPSPEIGQFVRWREPVCVKVVGLAHEDQAAAIKARIESVAEAVGLPAARPNCAVNVEIVFSDQPQLTMDMVAKRRDFLLGYWHAHERGRVKKVTHPIQSWYVTSTKGDGVGAAGVVGSEFENFSNFQTDVVDDPDITPPNGCADSRLDTSCLESRLRNVFIVADNKAVNGKDMGLVADYLVMLALSEPRSLDGCAALPSVLDAFATTPCPGRDPPDGLTQADAAYLTALYEADLRAKKLVEQSDIAGRMARILIRANAGAPAAQPAPSR